MLIGSFTGCKTNTVSKSQINRIAIIKTKNHNKYYLFQLLDNGKLKETDNSSNIFNENVDIYNLDSCFKSYIDNNEVKNELIQGGDKSCDTYPDVEKFNKSNIQNKEQLLIQIATLKHDLFAVNVFQIKDRVFVNVELNVNWISPSDLYEFKSDKLIQTDSFPDGMQIQKIYYKK